MYFIIMLLHAGQNIILENFMLRVKKKKYDNSSILIHKKKKKRFIVNLMGLKYRIINKIYRINLLRN